MADQPQEHPATGTPAQPSISTENLASALHVVMQAMGQQQETTLGLQHLLQQTIARPTETRCNVKMPSFNASNPEDYPRFEQAARDAICANRWPWPAAGYAIRSAFEGKALDIARSANPDNFQDTDSFLKALRELFVSPDSKQRAYAQFMARVQAPGEELAVFHSLLQDLWEKAFDKQEQSVPRLIEQFISGLSHQETSTQLRMELANNRLPNDYRGVLIQASNIISQYSLIQQDARRKATGGRWPTSFGIPPSSNWNRPNEQGPVPMEIGSVNNTNVNAISNPNFNSTKWCAFHNSNTHSGRDCRAQQNRPQRTLWCSYHNSPTHNTNDCRMRQAQPNGQPNSRPTSFSGRNPPPGTSRPLQTGIANKPRNSGPTATDKCNNCGGIGHWRTQCPSKAVPSAQHRTNAVEESNTHYSEN